MRYQKHYQRYPLIALIACALSALFTSHAVAQTPCAATVCVNVGDPLVFTWTPPTTGPTPQGYNFLNASGAAALVTIAATNQVGPNEASIGNVFIWTLTATAAMAGNTTFYAVNDWICPLSGPCGISLISPTVSVFVNQSTAPLQPPPKLQVNGKP